MSVNILCSLRVQFSGFGCLIDPFVLVLIRGMVVLCKLVNVRAHSKSHSLAR